MCLYTCYDTTYIFSGSSSCHNKTTDWVAYTQHTLYFSQTMEQCLVSSYFLDGSIFTLISHGGREGQESFLSLLHKNIDFIQEGPTIEF